MTPRGTVLVSGTTLDEVKSQLAQQRQGVQETVSDREFVRITTAWPPDIGQWTHNRWRDAGNQALATDPINPQTQNLWFQWIDGEQEPQGCHAAMSAVTSAEGRLISLADFEVGALIRDGKYWSTAGRATLMTHPRRRPAAPFTLRHRQSRGRRNQGPAGPGTATGGLG